ncbi:restriction endonuclease [Salinarchaeum sp. Harcht-Bsk1]|uniref:restriction endonuclease n=1 Tax=Salinarchaeum sp. Harcht-Bsk1 TaxID=1333523 RepID=UPI0003422A02|nr:restriction endonuclease [Salinarchaeum sp. Harcht-Bsk1]AGN02399.1 restriction endonuclease [Salinarchaeum sp. Harcht-Bsk1]
MTLLDELSGFEFEEVMVEVFRHQSYSDVEQAELIADEGRDVTMVDDRDVAAGEEPTAVVVECKHTDVVSRPVVQKTHSAVHTYDYDGPIRAMIATTGRFTAPAREYAEHVAVDPDDVDFELLDGAALRELSEEIPIDLYNGKIEIVCDEAIAPPTDRETLEGYLEAAAADVHNLDEWTVGATLTAVRFEPVLVAETVVDANFETDVGVIHEVEECERSILDGHAVEPARHSDSVAEFVETAEPSRIALDDHALDGTFDRTDIERFEHDERSYREWLVADLADRHETTVSYTGDNGIEYERTCRPGDADVDVETLDPVYLPHVAVATSLGEYEYELELYAAGGKMLVRDAEFERCVHCEAGRKDAGPGASVDQREARSLTYCANCGAIACPDHTETERLVGEPVCTGCAVTGRFAGATRYFYDVTNRETFADAYAEMPLHRKVRENEALVAVLALVTFLLCVSAIGIL